MIRSHISYLINLSSYCCDNKGPHCPIKTRTKYGPKCAYNYLTMLESKTPSTYGIGERGFLTERAHTPEVAGSNPAPATILFPGLPLKESKIRYSFRLGIRRQN